MTNNVEILMTIILCYRPMPNKMLKIFETSNYFKAQIRNDQVSEEIRFDVTCLLPKICLGTEKNNLVMKNLAVTFYLSQSLFSRSKIMEKISSFYYFN